MWLELEVEIQDSRLRVVGRGGRGERPPANTLPPERGIEALQALGSKVGRAVRGGKALDGAVVEEAQAFHTALFAGELRDVLARLAEASKNEPLLVRLFAADRALAS